MILNKSFHSGMSGRVVKNRHDGNLRWRDIYCRIDNPRGQACRARGNNILTRQPGPFPGDQVERGARLKGEILILVVAEHIDRRLLPVGVPSDLALKAEFAIRRHRADDHTRA